MGQHITHKTVHIIHFKPKRMYGHITMRSSSVVVLFISITEASFRALKIVKTSVEFKSVIGVAGKSNSIRKLS